MNCEEIRGCFSEYLDGEAPSTVRAAVEKHIATCPDCAAELRQQQALASARAALPMEPLPADFAWNLRSALRKEAPPMEDMIPKTKKRSLWRKPWFKAVCACACLLLVVGAFAAAGVFAPKGNSAYTRSADSGGYVYSAETPAAAAYDYYDDLYVEESMTADSAAGAVVGENLVLPDASATQRTAVERKIIKNYSLSLQVDDFDAAWQELTELAATYGGYVESGSRYDYEGSVQRSGYLSLRVEATSAEAAVAAIGQLGSVKHSDFYSEDVTGVYYDTQARLEQYQAQRDRLTAMYERAQTIDELIALENQLTEANAIVDELQGTINRYDQLTRLSSIYIDLYSPNSYEQQVDPQGWVGFWQKAGEKFLSGLNGLLDALAAIFYFLLRILPALVVIAIVVWLVLLIVRRCRKKRQQRRQRDQL